MARIRKQICCVAMSMMIALATLIAPVDWMGVSVMVEAATETYGDYEYTVNGNGVTITKYSGKENFVSVPSEINDVPVVSIGELAFSDCSTIESVVLPESVTYLGNSFISGTKIKSITIPKSVTSVGTSSYLIYASATGPLTGAMELEEVIFEEGMTAVPAYMCSTIHDISRNEDKFNKIKTIQLPKSITSIGNNAFYGCQKLEKITLADSTEKIATCTVENPL